jgi:hypothetical protein
LIVGAYAVSYYTEPRFTKDLDIWIEPSESNAVKLYKALKEFGAPLRGVKVEDFTKEDLIYQIGVAPVRIDIMMGLPALRFEECWKNRKRVKFGKIYVNLIGIKELIKTKKKLGREQDLLDVKRLNEVIRYGKERSG